MKINRQECPIMFYNFARSIIAFCLLVINGRYTVQNRDKVIPAPFVLVSPHTSWLEILYLGVTIKPIKIHFMAKEELFHNKLFGKVLRGLKAFPVNRTNPGPSALKVPVKLLKDGNVLGIFPSGTRKNTHNQLKRGAVTIAKMAKVPIVPAYYDGPQNVKDWFKRHKVTIRYGEPIYMDDAKTKEALEEKSLLLVAAFEKLRLEVEASKKQK